MKCMYRGGNKGLYVLLSRTQAGLGRTVKQKQEEISRNHVQTFISPSVYACVSRIGHGATVPVGQMEEGRLGAPAPVPHSFTHSDGLALWSGRQSLLRSPSLSPSLSPSYASSINSMLVEHD